MRHNAPTRFTSDGSADRIYELSGAFESFREMALWVILYVEKRCFLKIASQVTL